MQTLLSVRPKFSSTKFHMHTTAMKDNGFPLIEQLAFHCFCYLALA